MATTQYNLHLKGFVGGADFDSNYVDYVLKQNAGKKVNVLIDSLGGSLATALSIASAFRHHEDVDVHFVGMNASAATIASLGAKHISMDANAMYLVHKCSQTFFEWGSLNADQFITLIKDCEKIKNDLDKLDLNVASMYASKCKKTTDKLIDLMAKGGWLTAQEALEWGFVDAITELPEEAAPRLTDAVASEMAAVGMPIPNIPIADKEGAFAKFLASLTALFRPTPKNDNDMKTEEQNPTADARIDELNAIIAERDQTIAQQEQTIADLQAQIAALRTAPADSSTQIVDDGKQKDEHNALEDYQNCVANATAMFNALP